MDWVLQGLRWNRCLVYLDDIISFGGTFSAALSNLTLIFERLVADILVENIILRFGMPLVIHSDQGREF